MSNFTSFLYLIASVMFILSLRGLSSPKTARKGNLLGVLGMILVVLTTIFSNAVISYSFVIPGILIGGTIGVWLSKRAKMTELPELVALFNGFGGCAAVFISIATFFNPAEHGIGLPGDIELRSIVELSLSVVIGAITFTGSLIAFGKLSGKLPRNFMKFPKQQYINIALFIAVIVVIGLLASAQTSFMLWVLVGIAAVLGILLITPIGGADMPVVISMLNSYSGFAAVFVGFTLQNTLLIIVGSLVGASGAILSYIMCKSMNRSFFNVIFGSMSAGASANEDDDEDKVAKLGSAQDAAFIMDAASDVIIVPGYGMAVAQAQHAVKELADLLKENGAKVRYAIHPVAGRMPGHMNVLLAEANVPYEDVVEMDNINRDFAQADVAFVIGANDITNPAAKDDPNSPIYGMPILDVDLAKNVLFVKRTLGPGYAGIDNKLFYAENTMMLLASAKKMVEDIIKSIKE